MATLTRDRDEHWDHYATCAKRGVVNPDLWHGSVNRTPWTSIALARHICLRHCPVREECRRHTPTLPNAVVAGTYYNQRGERSGTQPYAPRCQLCPPLGSS